MNARILVIPALSLAAIALSLQLSPDTRRAPQAEVEVAAVAGDDTTWNRELALLEDQLAARRERATKSGSWTDWEAVSNFESEHARLSGDYASYVRAGDALETAFAMAPEGAGPFASRASLNMRLHRLSRVEADLQALEQAAVVTRRDHNRIKGIRADIAFYSGDMKTAKILYTEVASAEPTVRSLAALARLAWKTGDFIEADLMLDRAEERAPSGTASDRAWLKLVRGLMRLDQDRLDDALAMYEEGLEIQPGYWLLEEHIAEVVMLKGDTERALRLYEDLVARTSNPEFMDQIASIWRDRGDHSRFAMWRDRAARVYKERLKLVPEAAIGHALDHYLELEEDYDYALTLAVKNHETRPGGEAKEKLVAALLLTGDLQTAHKTAAEMIDGGWRTADALALSALAHEAVGLEERANQDAAAANKIARHASERADWVREAMQVAL